MKTLLIVLFIIISTSGCNNHISTKEINKIKLLTSNIGIEYSIKIKEWTGAITIPEFKRPCTGWVNRYNR